MALPNSNILVIKDSKLLYTDFTDFNFLKTISINENQAIILFRLKDEEIEQNSENTENEFYYFHMKISKLTNSPTDINFNIIDSNCRYRREEEDEKDEPLDVLGFSEKEIYIVCETYKNGFQGITIYPEKNIVNSYFYNNLDIRNPVLTKLEKSLGIFYTHINEDDHYNEAFRLMNYPDCDDYYENKMYLIPNHYSQEIDFSQKVFMNNPYPNKRCDEQINVKFNIDKNITLINIADGYKEIESGKSYDSKKLILRITHNNLNGFYFLEYIPWRNDSLYGLIEGRTCRITFNTPKCLKQCYSCIKLGTETKNACLGCLNDSYYYEAYEGAKNIGFGFPHNCIRCNESCYTCTNKFTIEPITSTNCKICNYEKGYYHFFLDESICISRNTQNYWEKIFNRSIYLDVTPQSDNELRWRFCHSNCKKCLKQGSDEDNQCISCKEGLHFLYNQIDENGVGNCYNDYENNGFFLKVLGGMDAYYPCLNSCKKCKDEFTCDDCYKPLFLSPNNDSCVQDCGYCYAKDKTSFEAWQCVNCKTRYPIEKYNLNGTCYDTIPLITYKDPDVFNKSHHIINYQCNLLIGCKEGCFNCSPWYSEKCSNCEKGYYKEDFFGLTQPNTYHCFKERE